MLDMLTCIQEFLLLFQVQVFIVMEPDDLDELTFNLPLAKENGNGVNINVHAIQFLDEYCSSMSSQSAPKTK